MVFLDNAKNLQRELQLAGFTPVFKPINIGALSKDDLVENCKIIASKDQYNITYMEATSNWKGIATNIARNNNIPSLIVTSYRESYLILSTIQNITTTGESRPRHLVIDLSSKHHSMHDFVKLINAKLNDDFTDIDKKIQKAFDKFVQYKEALDSFERSLTVVIEETRKTIIKASQNNKKYDKESKKFLEMCRGVISNKLQLDDVTEMLLQHVLTYGIFSMLYDEHELHTTNAVARSLESIISILKIDVGQFGSGYSTLKLIAESITDSGEKQDFLKRVYETFYAAYDPDNRDSWGIVYTPSEVVDFMIRSSNWLLEKHFDKSISNRSITLLDPATGTGTFVTDIMRNRHIFNEHKQICA